MLLFRFLLLVFSPSFIPRSSTFYSSTLFESTFLHYHVRLRNQKISRHFVRDGPDSHVFRHGGPDHQRRRQDSSSSSPAQPLPDVPVRTLIILTSQSKRSSSPLIMRINSHSTEALSGNLWLSSSVWRYWSSLGRERAPLWSRRGTRASRPHQKGFVIFKFYWTGVTNVAPIPCRTFSQLISDGQWVSAFHILFSTKRPVGQDGFPSSSKAELGT